ncbi:phosphatidate phosphatase LPIN2 isoform X2 [Aethina tumida]|uniref:phosphatidate phosphatase LPIN2 isoform X2 n=1 Tax=Aethina tumida TaxID=116153 RepID=UPI0021476A37|nr:phosphatidate phosphatase LPIN2 isoform X2 [Aethina tumida]
MEYTREKPYKTQEAFDGQVILTTMTSDLDLNTDLFVDAECESGKSETEIPSKVSQKSILSNMFRFMMQKRDVNVNCESKKSPTTPKEDETMLPGESVNESKEPKFSMLNYMFWFMTLKTETKMICGPVKSSNTTEVKYDSESPKLEEAVKDKSSDDLEIEIKNCFNFDLKEQNAEHSLEQHINDENVTHNLEVSESNNFEHCEEVLDSMDVDLQNSCNNSYRDNIQMSLCGCDCEPSEKEFIENIVSFSDICENPSLLEDTRLTVKVNKNYYKWKVAAGMFATFLIYRKPLPQNAVQKLANFHTLSVVPQEVETPKQKSWWNIWK